MANDQLWQQYRKRFRVFGEFLPVTAFNASKLVICIPAYGESELTGTLDALVECTPLAYPVQVLVCFNRDKRMSVERQKVHQDSIQAFDEWIQKSSVRHLVFHSIVVDGADIPKWGVGWARKVVMDEAARLLDSGGILAGLDADCRVQENYLTEMDRMMSRHAEWQCAAIHFEHQSGNLTPGDAERIAQYELHLRYLKWAGRWTGHPHTGYTVGSSMLVRRDAYLLQGGMNTRQAGEDFYFMQKFMELEACGYINGTTVYPSSRLSDRVPFGTGRAMMEAGDISFQRVTIHFNSYRLIKVLFSALPGIRELSLAYRDEDFYHLLEKELGLDQRVVHVLRQMDFYPGLLQVSEHTRDLDSFRKRFYRYFNAFKLIRYLHEMRNRFFTDVPVIDAANELLIEMGQITSSLPAADDGLRVFRQMDKTLGAEHQQA